MAATPSTMLPLGTAAPDFHLPDATGRLISRDDFAGNPALLVMFLCNHCPYVKHVAEELVRLAREYQERGAGVVAISSNDVAQFPEDGPARMAEVAAAMGATFPYLYDETQAVAKAFHAACTPDFFLFGADRRLAYRGQLDGARFPSHRTPRRSRWSRGSCGPRRPGCRRRATDECNSSARWRASPCGSCRRGCCRRKRDSKDRR